MQELKCKKPTDCKSADAGHDLMEAVRHMLEETTVANTQPDLETARCKFIMACNALSSSLGPAVNSWASYWLVHQSEVWTDNDHLEKYRWRLEELAAVVHRNCTCHEHIQVLYSSRKPCLCCLSPPILLPLLQQSM